MRLRETNEKIFSSLVPFDEIFLRRFRIGEAGGPLPERQ